MNSPLLVRKTAAELQRKSTRSGPLDAEALRTAGEIVEDVRCRGEIAVLEHATRLGDLQPGAPLYLTGEELNSAVENITPVERDLIERTAQRIRAFAKAQLASIREVEVPIPGGMAGQVISPVECAGCYAPGGRFPLPSSVLMTAVTARVAGVDQVWVASPKPTMFSMAAAKIAGADGLIAAGGAQGIAALAFGAGPVPPCDTVVGPGNQYVTAAKQLVSGSVAIDMLAGPSELTVLADDSATPGTVAADLLAQAEHDPDAVPILVTTSEALIDAVEQELRRRLSDLPTEQIARLALRNGCAVLTATMNEAIEVCDLLAPEHLELMVSAPQEIARCCRHYGALFIGDSSAEVLGDYGAGPNHTLPTGGTARHSGGLSVFDFLRIRTWLRIDDLEGAAQLVEDAEKLAEIEGLAGHAQSARQRRIATEKR